MIDQKLLSELADRLFSNLPNSSSLNFVKEDITKTFRLVLEQTLSDLDLVTKQQFDIQSKVLANTREQLEALNKKVSALENS